MNFHSGRKISVLLSVFNGQNFLREAIDSILQQDYPDVELVVCDDGSTDRTREIIHEYSFKGAVVPVGHSENKGKVFSFQKAFHASSGDFIALMAHDDVLPKNSLAHRLSFLEQGKYNVAYCNGMICDRFLEPITPIYEFRGDLKFETDFRRLCWNNLVAGGLFLFRRRFFEELLPIEKGLKFEDWWLTWVSLVRNRSIPFQDEPLYFYRVHGSNDNGSYEKGPRINKAFKKDWGRHADYYDAFASYIEKNGLPGNLEESTLSYLKIVKEGKQRAARGELVLSSKLWKTVGLKKLIILNAVAMDKIHWLNAVKKKVRSLSKFSKEKLWKK